jgi:hypothetical protein
MSRVGHLTGEIGSLRVSQRAAFLASTTSHWLSALAQTRAEVNPQAFCPIADENLAFAMTAFAEMTTVFQDRRCSNWKPTRRSSCVNRCNSSSHSPGQRDCLNSRLKTTTT